MIRLLPRRRRVRILLGVAIVALAAYFIAGFAIAYHYKSMSRRHNYDVTPDDFGLQYETVHFTSEDGIRLAGWYIPPEDPENANGDSAIVIVHGHASNSGRTWQMVMPDGSVVASNEFLKSSVALHAAGFHLLMFDLRNHGESGDGPPVSLGLYEARDVQAALRWIAAQPGVRRDRIGIKAASMGGAASIFAAAEDARSDGLIRAMWVDSTFFDAKEAIADFLAWAGGGFLRWSVLPASEALTEFDLDAVHPQAVIGQLSMPIQLVHSVDDRLVTYRHAIELYRAANESTCSLWTTKGYPHNVSWRHPQYHTRMVQFFEQHLEPANPL